MKISFKNTTLVSFPIVIYFILLLFLFPAIHGGSLDILLWLIVFCLAGLFLSFSRVTITLDENGISTQNIWQRRRLMQQPILWQDITSIDNVNINPYSGRYNQWFCEVTVKESQRSKYVRKTHGRKSRNNNILALPSNKNSKPAALLQVEFRKRR